MSLRSKVAPALDTLGVLDAVAKVSRWVSRGDLTILMYHRIAVPGTQPYLSDLVISATPEEFEEQMRWLVRFASPIGFDDLDRIEEAGTDLPTRAVIVTFDDGYLDNYLQAFPILRRHRIPATFFLVTGLVGTREAFWWDVVTFALEKLGVGEEESQNELERLKHLPNRERKEMVHRILKSASLNAGSFPRSIMNWEEIREMASEGIGFGGHSVSHAILSNLDSDSVRREVGECKQTLEARLGKPITVFAYPVGRSFAVNDEAVRAVREAGYRYAVTTQFGRENRGGRDRHRLHRIGVTLHDSISRFKAKFIAPGFFTG